MQRTVAMVCRFGVVVLLLGTVTFAATSRLAQADPQPLTEVGGPIQEDGSFPQFFGSVVLGGKLFFTATDGTHGRELWTTDGTQGGTQMVEDIDPGSSDSSVADLTIFDGYVYFRADDGTHGSELWRSDGSAAGTTLVDDIVSGSGGSSPDDLTVLGGKLLFVDGADGQLWSTDGTTTQLVKTWDTGGGDHTYDSGQPPVVVGSDAYFELESHADGLQLWATDGTAGGTTELPLSNDATSIATRGGGIAVVGSKIFFACQVASDGQELCSYDTSTPGTPPSLVKDIRSGASGSSPGDFTPIGSTLYFAANDGTHGRELWQSDGTSVGTALALDMLSGSSGGLGSISGTLGTELLLVGVGDNTHGSELWSWDTGTAPANATLLDDIDPGTSSSSARAFTAAPGGIYYFTANDSTDGTELWRTDGSAAGTRLVQDLDPGTGGGASGQMAMLGSTLLLQGQGGLEGNELYSSDGSTISLVDNINQTGTGADVASATAAGDRVYFAADDGFHGVEPWYTDGTTTAMLADIDPGADGSAPTDFTAVGSTVYFVANDGTHGSELWKTDGTEAGTVMVEDIDGGSLSGVDLDFGGNLIAIGSTLYFPADDGTDGVELWRSDGTSSGTTMVDDTDPGGGNGSPDHLTALDGVLYYSATDGVDGDELWKYDGTNPPSMVADINPGSGDSSPDHLTVFDGKLWFAADDGTDGDELWHSDGTSVGTVLDTDIDPGSDGSSPDELTVAGNQLFFIADDGTHGEELWVHGTSGSATLVDDIAAGSDSSEAEDLTAAGSEIYFIADDETHGFEVWKSDGTAGGTALVMDIDPGSDDGVDNRPEFVAGGSEVYFVATDGTHGDELWQTDGTSSGTAMVEDLNPGSDSGATDDSTGVVIGTTLYVFGNDATSGENVWKLTLSEGGGGTTTTTPASTTTTATTTTTTTTSPKGCSAVDGAGAVSGDLSCGGSVTASDGSGTSASFPAGEFSSRTTVTVKDLANPGPSLDLPPPAGFLVGTTTVSLTVTDASGHLVTSFAEPIVLHFPKPTGPVLVAYSVDGETKWVDIPRMSTPTLPAGWSDGYYVLADGSVDVYTLHATVFGLLVPGAPPAPTGLTGSWADGALALSWGAPDFPDVKSYLIYIDGKAIKEVSTTSTSTRVIEQGGPGTYTVAAKNSAGTIGAVSGAVTVTPKQRPASAPKRIPSWAWHALDGDTAAAPKPRPTWYAAWRQWRLHRYTITS